VDIIRTGVAALAVVGMGWIGVSTLSGGNDTPRAPETITVVAAAPDAYRCAVHCKVDWHDGDIGATDHWFAGEVPAAPRLPVEAPPMPVAVAPAPDSQLQGSGSCTADYYRNSSGNCVHRPEQAPARPAGATAKCTDGAYSFSQHRQGTCSGHGGVAQWL
jgi:hypothetical protein